MKNEVFDEMTFFTQEQFERVCEHAERTLRAAQIWHSNAIDDAERRGTSCAELGAEVREITRRFREKLKGG